MSMWVRLRNTLYLNKSHIYDLETKRCLSVTGKLVCTIRVSVHMSHNQHCHRLYSELVIDEIAYSTNNMFIPRLIIDTVCAFQMKEIGHLCLSLSISWGFPLNTVFRITTIAHRAYCTSPYFCNNIMSGINPIIRLSLFMYRISTLKQIFNAPIFNLTLLGKS